MQRYLFLILNCALTFSLLAGNPNLIWNQTYGEAPYNQQFTHIALDANDNLFVGGYVYFGTYGNALQNKYSPLGAMDYTRMYVNNYTDTAPDEPVALFPDGQGGVMVFGYINRAHQLLHTSYYDTDGNRLTDYFLGDTTIGDTRPFKVIASNGIFYVLGELNGAGTLLKVNAQDSIYWSQPLHNNYNIGAGALNFDAQGNIVTAVFGNSAPELFIDRFNAQNGQMINSFDTHMDTMVDNDSIILLQIDNYDNIFISGLTSDGTHFQQKVVKFDTLGNQQWSATCMSPTGYFMTNSPERMRTDSRGNILINGLYQDFNDTLQATVIFKLSNDSGIVNWIAIDSGNFVADAALGLDMDDNVYLGTLKSYASASAYSLLWFNAYLADSGTIIWTRSFDNGANNTHINMEINNAGDVFFATNETTSTAGLWFAGRIGNSAGDAGIADVNSDIENMQLFPNPFHNALNISFSLPHAEKMRLKIYDITGSLLHDEEVQGLNGENLIFSKEILSAGMYIFQLADENGIMCRKAIMY